VRIFIADSDPQTYAIVQSQWPGAIVQGVSAWHSALSEIQAFRPDVLIIDTGIPDMDAAQIAYSLRQDPYTASIATIAVSANQSGDRIAALRGAGVQAFSGRPFDATLLSQYSDPDPDVTLELEPEGDGAIGNVDTKRVSTGPNEQALLERLELLAQLTATASSATPAQERLVTVSEVASQLVGADQVRIVSRAADGLSTLLMADSKANGAPVPCPFDTMTDPGVKRFLERNEEFCIEHTTAQSAVDVLGGEVPYDSILAVPFFAKGLVPGGVVFTTDMPRGYPKADRAIARIIGHVVGGLLQASTLLDTLEAGDLVPQPLTPQSRPETPAGFSEAPTVQTAEPTVAPVATPPAPDPGFAPSPPAPDPGFTPAPPAPGPVASDPLEQSINDLLSELDLK